MNTISAISAYRTSFDRNFWAFDDPKFGLVQELFMEGASALISAVVGDVCDRATLVFSATDFPETNCMLMSTLSKEDPRVHGHIYGAVHLLGDYRGTLWLCPALCHYFGDTAPIMIYARITAAN